jgi:hypothetical protein
LIVDPDQRARDLALRVGQQRIPDAVLAREAARVVDLVATDRGERDAAGPKGRFRTGQLTELVLAPGSPVAAIKHQDDVTLRERIAEREVAGLCAQRERRRGGRELAGAWANRGHAASDGQQRQCAHATAYET